MNRNLTIAGDYNFLLNELKRNTGQCVGVNFAMPSVYSEGHCITLVGGNYYNNPNNKPNGNVSIWHDSDRDMPDTVVNADDDVYTNVPTGAGNDLWKLGSYPTNQAQGYTTLCPGLNKPTAAMQNYDVAYYMQALDPDKVLNDPWFRVAGANANTYVFPTWLPGATDTVVQIGNQARPV